MPELPEVETIKKDLLEKVLNKKIEEIKIKKPKIIKNSSAFFREELKGSTFNDIKRIGKLLIFVFGKKTGSEKYLLIHLKMTGQLIYCDAKNFIAGGHANSREEERKIREGDTKSLCREGKYTHIVFGFEDKSKLFFNDLRQFGYLKIVNKKSLDEIWSRFGIEPLQKNFTWENFKIIFKNRKTNIKALLLNQNIISGIGNIYADEILFAAKVRPDRPADSLSEKEFREIFKASGQIMQKAINYRGTTFSDYVDAGGKKGNFVGQLKVYGREKSKCKRCKKGVIKKIRVAGRGTRYCPSCQF